MTTSQMHEFARVGAEARLRAIVDERQAIFAAFPELRDGAAPVRRTSSPAAAPARKRRQMSATERRAVAKRMKAYWAKRRTQKAGARKAAPMRKRKGGMSAEARQRQAERMKAYWAAKRAGAEGGPAHAAETSAEPVRKAGRKQGRKK